MARDGLGGARDLGRARRLFERSCDLGFDRDCDRGMAPVRETAVGEHEGRLPDGAPGALVEAARKCDSGLMSGCTRLGRAYESGNGVTRDFERAERLYELACDWGQLEACRSFRMLQGSMHRFPGL
jgi:TPR repeat protein